MIQDLSLGYIHDINQFMNDTLNVVVNDMFLFNILTTLVRVKNHKLFEFTKLFDVWVNQQFIYLFNKSRISYFNFYILIRPGYSRLL